VPQPANTRLQVQLFFRISLSLFLSLVAWMHEEIRMGNSMPRPIESPRQPLTDFRRWLALKYAKVNDIESYYFSHGPGRLGNSPKLPRRPSVSNYPLLCKTLAFSPRAVRQRAARIENKSRVSLEKLPINPRVSSVRRALRAAPRF
jgi:hypothetical protein